MSKISSDLAPDGAPFTRFYLHNQQGMQVTVMDWGATLLSIQVPLVDGTVREVILGCANPSDYLQQAAYLGATVGRYANRIRDAKLLRTGDKLIANQPPHQLHGGPQGFSHRRFKTIACHDDHLHLQLISAEGDQGFPGELCLDVHYRLSADNQLQIHYHMHCSKATPVAITNHSYFNLDPSQGDARQHQLYINADYFQPVDHQGLPVGPLSPVTGTSFDFRQAKTVQQDFLSDHDQQITAGYDHAFLLNGPLSNQDCAARLTSADKKLTLSLYTNYPVLQCYTGNYLAGTPSRSGYYENYQGIALEPGFLPDSPNHSPVQQPDCWIKAGERAHAYIIYHFISVN